MVVLEGSTAPTSGSRKAHRGHTHNPGIVHQPSRASCAIAQWCSSCSQQGLRAIKNKLNDVQYILLNEAEKNGIHFITTSMKMAKLIKSLVLEYSKLQFPENELLCDFSFPEKWHNKIGEVLI